MTYGLAVIACAAPLNVLGAQETTTVAIVAGEPVTEQELNTAVGNKLMRLRTEEYTVRRASLDEIITDRLLKKEAARRHVSVDELLAAEIESQVTVPPATELETIYEEVKDRFAGVSKEEALKQIAESMRRQEIAQRKSEFVRNLRRTAGVVVKLEPPRVSVSAAGPATGSATAPVTIVEFSDFECPYCGRAVDTLKQVRDTYGDKVRIVVRDFPLAIHRGAPKAAEAAHCAEDQGKFWQMHDRLFATKKHELADLKRAAAEIGLDAQQFDACLASAKHMADWKASQEEGRRAGIVSTPTFFLNGRMLLGAVSYETFAAAIDEELERTEAARAHATP